MKIEVAIIRYCPQLRFQEEIAVLSSSRATVICYSSIYRLDPGLEDGLLRVGGRLSKGAMPEEAKRPFILSRTSVFLGLSSSMCIRTWAIVNIVSTMSAVRMKVLDYKC